MKWMQVQLYFTNYNEIGRQISATASEDKPGYEYKELVKYLQQIVEEFKPNRFFFLFEDNPHLFLAMEFPKVSNTDKEVGKFYKRLIRIKRPYFVKEVGVRMNTADQANRNYAIDMYHAAAKYAFHRISKRYINEYNHGNENKVLHCLCNTWVCSWNNEASIYYTGLMQRGTSLWRVAAFFFYLAYRKTKRRYLIWKGNHFYERIYKK